MFKRITLLACLLASHVAVAETVEMKVNGLVCAFCAQGIEKTLRAKPATDAVFVSLERGLVAVSLKAGAAITDDELKTALIDAGYAVTDIKRTERSLDEVKNDAEAPAHE